MLLKIGRNSDRGVLNEGVKYRVSIKNRDFRPPMSAGYYVERDMHMVAIVSATESLLGQMSPEIH